MEDETLEPSWWLYRDLERNALGVEDELPKQEVIQAPNGIWIGKVERVLPDLFHMLKADRSGTDIGYVLAGTIERISKAEYETYLAFGAFDDVPAD